MRAGASFSLFINATHSAPEPPFPVLYDNKAGTIKKRHPSIDLGFNKYKLIILMVRYIYTHFRINSIF